jgi:type II secretory pathway pseudopilin PulG
LIDLIVTVVAIAFLAALLVYWIQDARAKARGTACRENLRKIGVALAAYAETHGTLPVVTLAGPELQLAHSPQALLLSYLPEGARVDYDPKRPWWQQREGFGAATITTFRCPATSHLDPVDDPEAARLDRPTGHLLGTTDYIVCKGANDSWCMQDGVSNVPLKQRGAFEIGRPIRPTEIPDGSAKTILVGEGAAGARWPLAIRVRPGVLFVGGESNSTMPALNFWSWPSINTLAKQEKLNFVAAGVFGSAATRLNKFPVLETIADARKLDDCRPSYRDGPHAVSGFRSEHLEGGFFLFADGSSRFLYERIGEDLLRSFSTIAGGESVQIIE